MTAHQATLARVELPVAPTLDLAWLVVEEGFTLAREHELESLFAIGNGYAGSRASLAEGSALSAPLTVVAGVFDSAMVPGLVPVADWTRLLVTIDGRPLRLDQGRNLEHRRVLDMRQGMLWREWRHQDGASRITGLRELRFASLADRHLLVQSMTLTAEDYSAAVSIDAAPSGPAIHVTISGVTVAAAVQTRLIHAADSSAGSTEPPPGHLRLEIGPGEICRLDRVVALYTSRDTSEPLETARRHAQRAIEDIAGITAQHRDVWLARWKTSDIRVEGDPAAQRALRLAIYHLVSAANPRDDRVSIGARGLAGTAYKGHVFWDTDIFMLPFFTLTYPEAARALLMYRYHTLPAARAKAARLGYRGALYAWESTDSGEEVTPPFVVAPDGEVIRILTGEQEQHISADVAFAVWSYWEATEDECFLIEAGAEILIETARFWASRVTREEDGRYHIRCVIGPDEYHETVDDNAYTNGLARWNLQVAAEVARLGAERWPDQWRALSRRLGLGSEEPRGVAARRPQSLHGVRRADRPVRAVPRLFCLGGHQPCRLRVANRTDGRAARSRAHSQVQDYQAARCRNADLSSLGATRSGSAQSEFRILRAALWTWKLAEPGNSRASGGSFGKYRAGGALFPTSSRDRLGEQHGERSRWYSRRRNGRIMAGGGIRLCRLASHARRT